MDKKVWIITAVYALFVTVLWSLNGVAIRENRSDVKTNTKEIAELRSENKLLKQEIKHKMGQILLILQYKHPKEAERADSILNHNNHNNKDTLKVNEFRTDSLPPK